jgi:adenylate kinase
VVLEHVRFPPNQFYSWKSQRLNLTDDLFVFMTVIVVTGTPGTGKTRLAQILALRLGFTLVDVHSVIEQKNICDEYDAVKECKIIDVDVLNKVLIEIIDGGGDLVIDSHMAHHLPSEKVDLVIVTKCDLKILKKRLEERGYPEEKVRENLDVEIFDNCLVESEEKGHDVMIVDTSRRMDEEELVEKVREKL